MKQISVCPEIDLPCGSMRAFEVEGRELLFVRDEEQVYAMRNVCPHQGARLSDGILSCGRAAAGVGEHQAEHTDRIVRCPWHNWAFDAADGTALHAPDKVRVATYRAGIENEHVYVVL